MHTSNPFTDDFDADSALDPDSQTTLDAQRAEWGSDAAYRPSTSEYAAHSLEHLAAAASDQYPYNAQMSGGSHSMMSTAPHYAPYQVMGRLPATSRRARLANAPATTSSPSNNDISSILNHSNTLSPVIDPSLQSVTQHQPIAPGSPVVEKGSLRTEQREGKVQDDHEMAALLRGIAEDHSPQRHEGALG